MTVYNNRDANVKSIGSSYALFDDGTDQTLLPIVGAVGLSGEASSSKFYDAGGNYDLYNVESSSEIILTVAATNSTARGWTIANDGQTGKLWVNLVGENDEPGVKQLMLIPNATVVESYSLAIPEVTIDYKFNINKATAGESGISVPDNATHGWPYTATGTIDVSVGDKILFRDVQ